MHTYHMHTGPVIHTVA